MLLHTNYVCQNCSYNIVQIERYIIIQLVPCKQTILQSNKNEVYSHKNPNNPPNSTNHMLYSVDRQMVTIVLSWRIWRTAKYRQNKTIVHICRYAIYRLTHHHKSRRKLTDVEYTIVRNYIK